MDYLYEDNSGFIKKLFMRHVGSNVAAQVVSTIGPIVCGAIAGSAFGRTGLAVTGLFSPLFFLAGFFGIIIAGGSSQLAAKYIAQDDNDSVKRIYTQSIIMTSCLAAVICAALIIFRDNVLTFIAGDGELREAARLYYVPSVVYMFFTVIVYMPLNWSRLLGKPLIALILTLTMASANIVFAMLFTYILNMGLEALAISQALSSALALIVALSMLHLPKNGLRFKKPQNVIAHAKTTLLLGSPPGLSRLYRFLVIFIMNMIFLNTIGAQAVAVYGVLNMLLRFITAFCNGVSGTQMPITGVLREERDILSQKQIARVTFIFSNIVTVAAVILLLFLRAFIARIFGVEHDDLDMFGFAFLCFCAYIPFYVNGSLLISWYTSVRCVLPANIIAFCQDMLFLPLFALFLADMAGYGIWLHLPAAGAAFMLFLPLTLFFMRSRHKDLSRLLLIEKKTPGAALSFSVECEAEKASHASASVGEFCEAQDMDAGQTMLLSLAIEEMIMLIANYKAGKGGARSELEDISVRLLSYEGGIILRLRVGGVKFNPIDYYEKRLAEGGDLEELIDFMGIKYIVEKAEVVYYTETFGVNNLVIII